MGSMPDHIIKLWSWYWVDIWNNSLEVAISAMSTLSKQEIRKHRMRCLEDW